MADRPLRPATDRRLGRPLPHQQPNRTQAAPKAHHCFGPQPICGISPSFPGLSPTSGYVPTRYSPVRHSHCWACDLHVLSMPPAFTLSQDQTLRFIHQPASPQEHQLAPNHPTLTLSPTYPQPPNKQPDTKPHHPRHPPPLSSKHPSADRASHPLTPSSTSAPPDQKEGNAIHQPSTQPSIIRTAKNQTLPKPISLSKNNTSTTRDNLRGGHHHSDTSKTPPTSAGETT